MPPNELAFEVTAQEIMDPNTGVPEPIEFDDLDTILQPAVPSANEADGSDEEGDKLELELEAEDIDTLLGASGKLKA